jgi:UDP-N-acetylmuramyl pentapeptide phosphotransferase/UDP-N-acetylglucosamine-1-phosphate transferase|tara:strand:- start:3984 stop:5003 length:1020 start_codon:yes stop_codon:yes gene_type:complete
MNYINILIIPLIVYLLNTVIQFKNLLPSLSGEKHQLFVGSKKIPLSGGFIIIVTFLFLEKFNLEFYYLFSIMVFGIGFFSDLRILTSPRIRFYLQILFTLLFIIFYNFHISSIRIFFIDYLLSYKFFSYFFVIFCLLIIVNGTNFIDGLNGLVLGYFISILIIIYNLKLFESLQITQLEILYFIELLSFLLLFNLFNKLYIGDGGSYLLGFGFGILLIAIYESNKNISPFFIILLLWYPCFENLFSIIRKYRFNKSPLISDNKHFHQLFFYFVKKRFGLSKLLANNLCSIIINIFNVLTLSIGAQNIYSTQLQVLIVTFNITIYIFVYLRLFNYRFKKI